LLEIFRHSHPVGVYWQGMPGGRMALHGSVETWQVLAWDFTCPDTVASSHLLNSSKSAGLATLAAESSNAKNIVNSPLPIVLFLWWLRL